MPATEELQENLVATRKRIFGGAANGSLTRTAGQGRLVAVGFNSCVLWSRYFRERWAGPQPGPTRTLTVVSVNPYGGLAAGTTLGPVPESVCLGD